MDMNNNAGSTEARLEELLKKQEKMLRITRLSGLAVLALAVTIVIACVILVPKAVNTMLQIETLAQEASVLVENANTTLEGIDAMSAEIQTAADGINGLVEDNSSVLTESMTKLNSIDFEGLNKAITDLGAVVEPMARFFSKFK